MATQTITHGAQVKIHEAHRGSKIHFVSGHDLASLVAAQVPDFLSDIPLSITSYLRKMRLSIRELDASLDILTIDGQPIYLPQEIARLQVDPYTEHSAVTRHRHDVDMLAELDGNRPMLIEAPMGGGKSKLLRHLVQSLAHSEAFALRPLLPVIITYRELTDNHDGSLLDVVQEHVPPQVYQDLPENAKIVVFVDAIDEKDQSQEAQFAALKDLIREARSDNRYRLLFTSRPIGTLEFDKEFAHLITRYEIRRLSMAQIIRYLNKICDRLNLTRRIVDDIRRSPLFAELPKIPMAAVLLAEVLKDDRKDLPATLPELYAKYLELALGRWDIEKGLQSQQEYEVLQVVLMELAQYILDNQLESISVEEFSHRVGDYLARRNLDVTTEAVVANGVRRTDVLVLSRDGMKVRFKHRTFAEFLEAERRHRLGTMRPSVQAFEVYWANVYYFACGRAKDAPRLIGGLAKLAPTREQHRWLKPMNMANFVMAAYATPYDVIEEAVYESIVGASSLFVDIVGGKMKSRFSGLSRMHLLGLMQLIIRDHYGFEFLRPALEGAAVRGLEELSGEVEPYFLFLLAVAAVDAGNAEAFRPIMEEYRGVLPIDISLGLVHEKGGKARSKLMKRFERRLKRKIRGNKVLSQDVKLLYERPVIYSIARDAEG